MKIYEYHHAELLDLTGALFEDINYFHACTATKSSGNYKTRKGAEKWLARNGYVANN